MHLRLTLVDCTGHPTMTELAVQAGPGARVADLRAALRDDAELGSGDPSCAGWYVDGTPLSDGHQLGWPPLLDGSVVRVGSPDDGRARTGWPESADSASPLQPPGLGGVLRVAVTSGPDAGASWPVTPGRQHLGRAADASVRIDDPDLSRLHVVLDVTAAGVRVWDAGSTNGTLLGGQPLGHEAVPWPPGVLLKAGSSTMELKGRSGPSAATTADGSGHLLVNRPPRLVARVDDVDIRLPGSVAKRSRGRIPLLSLAIPLMLALPMAWIQHSPTYLLFGLMSPAMLLGNWLSERRGGRRDHRRQLHERDLAAARVSRELAGALDAEARLRHLALPDCAELLATAEGPLSRLWERRRSDEDFLRVRIGLGSVLSHVRVQDSDTADPPVPQGIDDVPVAVDLATTGVLGVAGPLVESTAVVRAMVAQVAGWHSPGDVRIVVLAASDAAVQAWSWVTLLPHLRADSAATAHAQVASLEQPEQLRRRLAELLSLVDERHGQAGPPPQAWSGPHVVAVLDGVHELRRDPEVARLLDVGPRVGVSVVCRDAELGLLPVECRAFFELAHRDGLGIRSSVRGLDLLTVEDVVPDQVSPGWCQRLARALAPLRDATPEPIGVQLPRSARLLELLDARATEPSRLALAWRDEPGSTAVVIGVTAEGPHRLDLRHDGPHVLIGGTTGSGKSELLQTMIASLAVASSPEQLGFVLIDYKGGSAFAECARLPHTLGLVTDLDPHLTERALLSLTAELQRREKLLRDAGAKDLDDFLARRRPGEPQIARLVLVVDEFRMLADELPTFLDGMVRIAALGRSLGVHLVLATQRPAGVVSADIAANVNLRIALRVRDQIDSEDVVESRLAATISERTPGRAFARTGSNPLVPFQTARVAGHEPVDSPAAVTVEVLASDRLGDEPRRAPTAASQDGLTDLARIVATTRAACRDLNLTVPRSPWLPPLPDLLTVADLVPPQGRLGAAYAVIDRPEQQAQETVTWDLERDGHLAVIGTARSGRTSLLRTLAGGLAAGSTPGEVHLHAIDGGSGGLAALAQLPHAGVVAGAQEMTRGVRLLDRLVGEVSDRQRRLGRSGHDSLAAHNAEVGPAERFPHVVLLLDGWESLVAAWESVDHGRPVEVVQRLMRDGTAVGLRLAVAGDRGLLMSRLASQFGDRIVLRLADPTDLALAGIPAVVAPQRQPPGRGVSASSHAELQVAVLGPDASGSGQIAALGELGRSTRACGDETRAEETSPLQIRPLPTAVSLRELRAGREPSGTDDLVIGVGGDDPTPLGIERTGTALVAGPPRSGRSTALTTIGLQVLDRGGHLVALTAGGSPLGDLADRQSVLDAFDRDAAGELRRLLEQRPDCTVVADDVERMTDSEVEDVVLQWFKRAGRGGGLLVVAGSSTDLAGQFRGLSVVARRPGQGVLLNPTTYADGELLGVRVGTPESGDLVPGRGLLVRGGTTTPIQLAG
jgi:S-DNA-T family DNA segregation ATPase FtsK/SpoIIIE